MPPNPRGWLPLLLMILTQGLAFAQPNSGRLLTTFSSPVPADYSYFGSAVAALESGSVLIGAPNETTGMASVGTACLFNSNGVLLTTVSNPAPTWGSGFGRPVAFLGSDRVLIGVRLFSTNGTLLTTFANPTGVSGDSFGYSVAAVGIDRVLIGAPYTSIGANNAGRAYLFGTNGTLLTTITNPAPAADEFFGGVVCALGTDRMLVSAPGDNSDKGSAYLFSAGGVLLATFTNPAPATSSEFGYSMTAIGSSRVLIGTPFSHTPVNQAGAAYLFNTNGSLANVLTNPTPTVGAEFGISVAAVGTDRALVGADQANNGVGAAYVFNANGALLTTLTNPTPQPGDLFGSSVAALGSDRVLIGASNHKVGALFAGSAYLFDLPYPQLGLARNGAAVSLKWVSAETGLVLQQAGALATPTLWSNSTDAVSVTGLTNVVQQPLGSSNRFFRLSRP